MKLRHPFLIDAAAFLGATIVGRLVASLDFRVDYGPWGKHPTKPRDARFIYAFWHDCLIAPTAFRTNAHIMISQHADGELIAQVVRHFRFGVVRGSKTRGGTGAVLNSMKIAERAHLCVTPDGPRGPRHVAKQGTAFLAAQTGLPIVPVGIGYSNAWRAPSWDRFAVPLPFSQARLVFAEPVVVPESADRQQVAMATEILQNRLSRATAEAERWAKGQPRHRPAIAPPLAKSA